MAIYIDTTTPLLVTPPGELVIVIPFVPDLTDAQADYLVVPSHSQTFVCASDPQ